jgi:glycosyltransferase involved in cell wall biosynthesis
VPQTDLVSIVVPAYQAQATIGETLDSLRAQTHSRLEIIVVDDGSTDATATIVEAHCAADPRVQLVHQENCGVAAARNRGFAESSAQFIAPVDADDLCSPDKIERLLDALERGGQRAGMAYSWFALIDADSRVIMYDSRSVAEGNIVRALCRRNLVGNGSGCLIRRQAFEMAGGYDASLHAEGAQGCEDYKLYLAIAEHWDVVLVRDYLTGYRELPGNMSTDVTSMARSRALCTRDFSERHPELRDLLRRGFGRLLRMMLARSARERRWDDCLRVTAMMFRHAPAQALVSLVYLVFRSVSRGLAGQRTGEPFLGCRSAKGVPKSSDHGGDVIPAPHAAFRSAPPEKPLSIANVD